MRIVCVSDTHMLNPPIPPGDLLIHAGDLALAGTPKELARAAAWLESLPHQRKVLVAGNHDRALDPAQSGMQVYVATRAMLERTGVHYLFDSGVEIAGLNIYGSPWTPPFNDWAFMLNDEGREIVWSAVPGGTDILVTHGPPRGILDRTYNGEHVGCEWLLKAVQRVRPKLHVFGHIHESYGQETIADITFINASISAGPWNLRPENPPVVIDL